MGRPCKCCGECEEVIINCYIEDEIAYVDVDNATSVRIIYRIEREDYLDPNSPYQKYLDFDKEDLDEGSLRFSIPLSELIVGGDDEAQELGNGAFYQLNATASNTCSSRSCSLSCQQGMTCIFGWPDPRGESFANLDSNEDFCYGEYVFGWVVNKFNNGQLETFDENTKFFMNGVEIQADVVEDYQARGTFYVAACDLQSQYELTVEAEFCSGFLESFCLYTPTCMMKKNTLVKEITGIPDSKTKKHTATWYHFDGVENCGDIRIVDVREDTITGLGSYNGTYIFDKCGTEYYEYYEYGQLKREWVTEMRKVGEGTRTVKDTRTTFFIDTFGTGELTSFSTVNEFVQELEYFVSGANNAQPTNDGHLFARQKGSVSPHYSLFGLAFPCEIEEDQGYGDGIIHINDARNLTPPRNVVCMDYVTTGGNPSNATNTLDPNYRETCCVGTCIDESTDAPVKPFSYIDTNWTTSESQWDSCSNVTTPEYKPVIFGSYKVYYDCL